MSEKKIQIDEVGTVAERINLLVDYFCKGNKTAFGRAADIQSGVLAGIVGGRGSKPGFEILQKLLTAYPGINPTWLLFGRGPMLLGGMPTRQDKNTLGSDSEIGQLKQQMQVAGYRLATETERLGILNHEEASLIAQKAAIMEREVDGELSQDDRNRYQDMRVQWLQILGEQERVRIEIQAATKSLADAQHRYILAKDPLAIEYPYFEPGAMFAVYRIEGELDNTRPYGGLLARRMERSQEEIIRLVAEGKIKRGVIEKNIVTEKQVRKFLGEE